MVITKYQYTNTDAHKEDKVINTSTTGKYTVQKLSIEGHTFGFHQQTEELEGPRESTAL